MNRLITKTNLGRDEKRTLLTFFNTESGNNARSITTVKNLLFLGNANDTYAELTREYNNKILTGVRLSNARSKELRDAGLFGRKSTIISGLFKANRRPTNMDVERSVKEGRNIYGEFTYSRNFVDVYDINLNGYFSFNDIMGVNSDDPINSIFRRRLLPLLGSLYRKYRGEGVIQIDVMGHWATVVKDEDFFRNSPEIAPVKISVESIVLKPSNYRGLVDTMQVSFKPPDTESYFLATKFIVKFIKPVVGGCYSCSKHGGKNMKLDDLTLYNPYSTNNNCFFKCIEEHLLFKTTKLACNSIRAEFGIPDNEMIPVKVCYEIFKKYVPDKKITFYTNGFDMLDGDDNGDVKIFCMENHYLTLIGKAEKCLHCGHVYQSQNNHVCNASRVDYFQTKVCDRVIEKSKKKLIGLQNQFVLHYDIETERQNDKKQHTPYIVGYSYYELLGKTAIGKDGDGARAKILYEYEWGEKVYGTFAGINCMNEFYDFLGSEEVSHVKYINAYNGAGFDHYYLFGVKVASEEKVGDFILANGNILTADIQGKKLIDLNRHITGSLDSNLKEIKCTVAKGSIDHNISTSWETTDSKRKAECEEYLKCDVMGLSELYEKLNVPMFERYGTNLCEMLTTSSGAFNTWRDHYLGANKIHLLDAVTEKYCRMSIYGARCYPNKKEFKSVLYDDIVSGKISYDNIDDYLFDADVVSLYPTAMANYLYPVGKEIMTCIYQYEKPVKGEPLKAKLGFYHVDYTCPKTLLNPVLPRHEEGVKKLIWDLSDGSGWYSSVDIERAKKKGYVIKKVHTGFYWKESAYVFKDYINTFYKMKETAEKETPSYALAKLYLNGLYGKMLQRAFRSESAIIKSSEEFWVILQKNIIQTMEQVNKTWLVTYMPKPEFAVATGAEKPTQLGSLILAYSRQIMDEYYDKCGNSLDRLPYYYDTDSLNVHSSCLDTIKIDKQMGGIDDDVGGKIIWAIYIAPKTYAFQYVINEATLQKRLVKNPKMKYETLSQGVYLLYHFRGKGVERSELGWEHYIKMKRGESHTFYRKFQILKINVSRQGVTKENDFFSHRHRERDETGKVVNGNIWAGRDFIEDDRYDETDYRFKNVSVPKGFDKAKFDLLAKGEYFIK